MKTFFQNKHYVLGILLVISFLIIGKIAFSLRIDKPMGCTTGTMEQQKIEINPGVIIDAWVADSAYSRYRGLSVCSSLASHQGMLFVFNQSQAYSFWMKDMKFPIDIFWLNENREIVFIKKNADPSDYPESYTPPRAARYVLETRAGIAEKESLKIGDQIVW